MVSIKAWIKMCTVSQLDERRIGCKVSFESVLAAVRERRICISTHVPNTKYSKCSSVC